MQNTYRLYIDEVGNADLKASADPNHRFLSLTGVILPVHDVRSIVHPEMEALKERFFDQHPDDPLIFHRRDMSRRLYPFEALRNPDVEAAFNAALLEHLSRWNYRVITVTIDKAEHASRYTVWQFHPYHYCLQVLLERYVMFLEGAETTGDVMAEARGKKEDDQLSQSFARVLREGTNYVAAHRFPAALTTEALKLKLKTDNVAGLQIADMLAHPSSRFTIAERAGGRPVQGFGAEIVRILKASKYVRKGTGAIWGWGLKWLP